MELYSITFTKKDWTRDDVEDYAAQKKLTGIIGTSKKGLSWKLQIHRGSGCYNFKLVSKRGGIKYIYYSEKGTKIMKRLADPEIYQEEIRERRADPEIYQEERILERRADPEIYHEYKHERMGKSNAGISKGYQGRNRRTPETMGKSNASASKVYQGRGRRGVYVGRTGRIHKASETMSKDNDFLYEPTYNKYKK